MFIREFQKEWESKYKVENFFEREAEVFEGRASSLISIDKPMGRVLETIKSVSRRILYPSFEAESIELTGYAVITGILKNYEKILQLPYESFLKMVNGDKLDNADIERRLYNRLGRRYITAYKYAICKLDNKQHDFAIKEWWLRVHLLIDHVSGMTDEFALETYQMLEGINLMHK